jgi:hypothetical protein
MQSQLSSSSKSDASTACLRFEHLNNYQKQAVQLDIVKKIIGNDPLLDIQYLLRTIGSTDADIVIFKDQAVVAQIELAHLADKSYKDIDAAINSRRRKLKEFTPFSLGFHSYFIQMGGKWSLSYQRALAANNWLAIHIPNITKLQRHHLRRLSRFIHRILKQAHVYKAVVSAVVSTVEACSIVVVEDVCLALLESPETSYVDDEYLIRLYYDLLTEYLMMGYSQPENDGFVA